MAASPPQTPCVNCRSPLPVGARFCNACGAQQPAQPAPRANPLAQTQYVAASPVAAQLPQAPIAPPPVSQPAQPAIIPPPPSSRPSAGKLGAQTVLGVASPMAQLRQQQQAPAQQPPPSQAEPPKYVRGSHPGFAPAPPPPGQPQPAKKQPLNATMVGVPNAPVPSGGGAKNLPKGTLVGVAMPGVAPTHPQRPQYAPPPQPQYAPPPQPQYAPPPQYPQQGYPAPPQQETPSVPPPSLAPVAKPSRVVPIVLVLVALVGVAVAAFLVLRPSGPPPLSSSIEGDTNAPRLVVKCGACADGSVLDLGGKTATFAGGSASIALASSELKAGKNSFKGKVTPKDKKPEDVELEVLIPYLVHPSLAPLSKGDSKVEVVFDLADDVKSVEVDGEKLTGGGEKTHTIAIPAPAEDARVFEKTVEYEVQQKAGPTIKGSLKLAIPYATLRLGLPGRRPFVVGDSVDVSGRSAAGATVLVGDSKLTADESGVFKGKVKVAADTKELTLVAYASKLAPRSTTVALTHAASADEVSKTLKAEAKTPFDKVAAKPDDYVGKAVSTRMTVEQIGEEDGRAVAIGETKCPTSGESKCPAVKVLLAPGAAAAKGDVLDVLGVVTRAVTSEKTKTTAVEVDAAVVASVK